MEEIKLKEYDMTEEERKMAEGISNKKKRRQVLSHLTGWFQFCKTSSRKYIGRAEERVQGLDYSES